MKKLIMAVVLIAGCTDADIAHLKSYGSSAHIECWSGTLKIFDGHSSGKVGNATNSDGYEFNDAADGKLKQVTGNCVVSYGS